MGTPAETTEIVAPVPFDPRQNLKPFQPGADPRRSAGGLSTYERQLRAAIQKQESAERVCQVVDAMRAAAMEGDARAAKVYFSVVGIEQTLKPPTLDLSDAPPGFAEYIMEKLGGAK